MVPHLTSREALSSGVTRPGSHSEAGPHLAPFPAGCRLRHHTARSPAFLGVSPYPWLHCCPGSRRGPKFVGSFVHSQLSSEDLTGAGCGELVGCAWAQAQHHPWPSAPVPCQAASCR